MREQFCALYSQKRVPVYTQGHPNCFQVETIMKPTIPTLFLAATLCASTLVMPQARAQDYISSGAYNMDMWTMYGNNNYITNNAIANNIIANGTMQNDYVQPQASKDTGNKSPRPVRRTPKKALTTTTYRESPAVTKRTVMRFTDWIATKANSTDAAAIRRDFENDMLGRWAKESSENGLHRGDVADALTS